MPMRKFNKILAAIVCGALVCGIFALTGCSQGSANSGSASASSESTSSESADKAASATSSESATATPKTLKKASAEGPYATGAHHALLTVEGYDPITIELDADDAPASVANFCSLAESGYYDGLTFYRFVDGFCMQGGTKGNNASGNDATLSTVVGEFSSNGYENELADNFKKGVVAMARTQVPDSATSTFFITLDSNEGVSMSLNGQYAAFGTIDEAGMQIVDQIVADYLTKVSEPTMGMIDDEADQAKITSIEIVD